MENTPVTVSDPLAYQELCLTVDERSRQPGADEKKIREAVAERLKPYAGCIR